MRLGANYNVPFESEEQYDEIIRDLGAEALTCPLLPDASPSDVARYKAWLTSTGLPLAEVGVWVNVLDGDEAKRHANIVLCQKALAMAEELGSRCCVNIAGSSGDVWDGYDVRNFTPETHDMVVQSVREIIDAVKPTRTCYSLEPMPWMLPSSPEEYLQLMKDVDRKAFGVHLDLSNMINSLERYRDNRAFIDRCFDLLGPQIRSIHLKDVHLQSGLPCMLHEMQPGLGELDLKHMLRRIDPLDPDMPVLVEHRETYAEYKEAIDRARALRDSMSI